jgi:integrase
MKVSTHTLRKTFAYHQMLMSNNDPRKLLLLSKMLGHSSVTMTLEYIGITNEEIEQAYRELNLGSSQKNYLNSRIGETESAGEEPAWAKSM